MEQELRRLPDGTYTGAMTDEHICGIFGCCGDWNRREVRIGALTVYVYAIDGITSGGDASEYVVKPLMQDAFGGTMDELYDRALHRTVYNSVAVPCGDLQSTAEKLVNGFTVVLLRAAGHCLRDEDGRKALALGPGGRKHGQGRRRTRSRRRCAQTRACCAATCARLRCGCMRRSWGGGA